jgi:hypothetical protein
MAVASTKAEAAPSPGEAADPSAVALRAAAVESVALVLVNTAQHVQRTSVLVEAAVAASLARALAPGVKPDATWTDALEVSRQAMTGAMEAYRQALDAAIGLGKATSS